MPPSLPKVPRARERRFRRKSVRVLVDFKVDTGIRCEYATTLGAGGLFVETDEPVETGTPIRVRFRLPQSDQVHEIEGRVVWQRRTTAGAATTRPPGMGIEFLDAAEVAALARDLDGRD